MSRLITFGRPLADRPAWSDAADWQQADPRWIETALGHALARSGGGWFAVDAQWRFAGRPRARRVAGQDLVFWRSGGRLLAAPNACPHLGASLADGCVRNGSLVCGWHGLRLGPQGFGAWRPLPVREDGVLAWVRVDGADETPAPGPALPGRPARFVAGVVRLEANCEVEDVLANRLDPWHGVHFHPYSFRRLRVLDRSEDELTVRVAYGVAGPLAVEVDARFHCPDRRTIVMTIVAGEGQGSVVETHVTPTGPGRCAIVEATLATSDRPGFAVALRAGRLIRPLIQRAARRLWRDDIVYAERRRALRAAGPGGDLADQT